jgi:hypothetical protein
MVYDRDSSVYLRIRITSQIELHDYYIPYHVIRTLSSNNNKPPLLLLCTLNNMPVHDVYLYSIESIPRIMPRSGNERILDSSNLSIS